MRCPTLVGRDAELARLRAAASAAAAGGGGLLLLTGDAGSGKSRLTRAAADEACDAGLLVVTGRAVPASDPVPLRPVVEAVLAAVRARGVPSSSAVDPFLPVLAGIAPGIGPAPAAPGAAVSPVAVGEGVLRLLAALAPAGCLLVLEDLHWADPESLSVLEYLADNLGAAPVACLATVRTGQDSPARAVVERLVGRRVAGRVQVGRLPDESIEELVRSCLRGGEPPPEVVTFVRTRCDGLPLFAEELLAGLVDAGALVHGTGGWTARSRLVPAIPLTFGESVRSRLDGLGADARAVVRAAAVLGRRFEWGLLPAVTGTGRDVVLAALEDAVHSALLAPDPDAHPQGFLFHHALTREAVLADVLPPLQAELAGRAAAAVEAAHPDLDGDQCVLAADLHALAGDGPRAARLLLTAAGRATVRGALSTAERMVARAAELGVGEPDLAVVLDVALLDVLALAGRVADAQRTADRVVVADPGRAAAVHLRLARAMVAAGDWELAARRLDAVAQDDPEALALRAHVEIGRGDPVAAARTAQRALDAAGGLPAVRCEALEVLGRSVRERDLAAAEDAFERALRTAEEHGLALWRTRALHELGALDLLTTCRPDRLEAAGAAARAQGALAIGAVVDLQLAAVLAMSGREPEAVAVSERCVDISRRLGLATLPVALVQAAELHAARGDAAAMETVLAEACRLFPEDPEVAAKSWGEARFWIALREGDHDRALYCLDRGMDVVRRHPAMPFAYRGVWALLHASRTGDAASEREEVRRSGMLGLPLVRASLMLADAVAAGHAGERDAAEGLFAESSATFGEPPQGVALLEHHMRVAVARAALRDGWGSPTAWLGQALAWFDEHGYPAAASACRATLRHAGAPVPRRARGANPVPAALRDAGVTSRELDVLRLLALGLSNAEIGARLHLSPRTVETHVSRLLTRTGARSRTELAAVTARDAGA